MRWRPPVWLALLVVGLAAAMPAILYSLLVIREAYEAQRASIDQAALQHARAVALRLDRELSSRIELLRGLALSPDLGEGDLRDFHDYAVTAAKEFDYGWIVLIDSSGRQILNTRRPFGNYLTTTQPDVEDQVVFTTRAPNVSGLFIGRATGDAIASIAVPVFQDGEVTHVLSFRSPPQAMAPRLWGQEPRLGIIGVVDANGIIIARSERQEFIGRPASASVRDAMRRGMRDGIIDFTTLEGIRSFGALAHSTLSGWVIGLAVDEAVLLAPLRKQIMRLAAVGAGALAIAGLLTFYFARRISRDASLLSHASQVLAAGRKPPIREDGFVTREFATIADAMLRAGARLVDRTQRAELLAEERAMLVREVHYRVKNNLQTVTSLIQLQRQGMDEAGREALAGLSRRVGEIAALHEQLYRGREPDRIDFVEYLKALCERLAAVTGREIVCTGDPTLSPTVPVDVAIPLGLLVNELITNAAKHGGPDAPIEVSMRRGADGKTYALSVTDDGPAVPANAANDESLGMRLITALASQLQAQIRFASDDGRGARVELLVPDGLTGPDSGASD
jgi:two-component sensor histidine kinase